MTRRGRVDGPLLRRSPVQVTADDHRVAARLFLPGQELVESGASRADGVVARCQAMTDDEVAGALDEIMSGYGSRHRDLTARLDEHYRAIAHRVPQAGSLDAARRCLIGAHFTREVSVETAAVLNPSVVPHPVQDGPAGSVRFVMSVRAVGEGHLSTITFRSGTLRPGGSAGEVTLDPPAPQVVWAPGRRGPSDRGRLRQAAVAAGADPDSLDFLLTWIRDDADETGLEPAVAELRRQRLTRTDVEPTIAALRTALRETYEVTFPADSSLAERTLFPALEAERNGLEDARFVRLVRPGGDIGYSATYTAFDGAHVASRRLDTDDFVTFRSGALTGTAAADKGMALFPRQVGGRYLALSRWDRENNAVTSSVDGFHWPDSVQLQAPTQGWEAIQLGNCGSPMETEAGWLVLTHGVGPMRAYAIGALLLDREQPHRVLGRLTEPLLRPAEDERDGYVPNVVYSCGGMVHQDTLLLPYGCSDSRIRFALVDLPGLLARLRDA